MQASQSSCSSTAPAPAVVLVLNQLHRGTGASPADLGRGIFSFKVWAAQRVALPCCPNKRACDQSSGRPGVTATFRDPVREIDEI